MPGTERKKERAVSTLVQAILWFMKISESPFSSHCPPEKSKAGCAGSCSESVASVTGVLTGVLTDVRLEGCGWASPPGKVFS